MRQELLLGLLVEVHQRLAGTLLVHAEVVVGAVGHAFQFLDAEGELVFDVVGPLRVERALAVRHVEDVQLLARDADLTVEVEAGLQPLVGQAHAVVGVAEVFDLHLLELARAEGEIARVDLVAEGLAALRDAEGQLHAVGIEHVLVLHEDRLRGLRAEVGDLVAGRAEVRLEHQVELAGLGQQAAVLGVEGGAAGDFLAAVFGQLELLRGDLLVRHVVGVEFPRRLVGLDRVLAGGDEHREGLVGGPAAGLVLRAGEIDRRAVLGGDLVGTQAGLGKEAVAHRVAEAADVAGGNEDLLHGQDRAVHAEHVVAFLDGLAPPVVLEVALQFGAERAVVPAAVETAVQLAGLENEAAAFAQRNDFLHAGGVGEVLVGHRFERVGRGADGIRAGVGRQGGIHGRSLPPGAGSLRPAGARVGRARPVRAGRGGGALGTALPVADRRSRRGSLLDRLDADAVLLAQPEHGLAL